MNVIYWLDGADPVYNDSDALIARFVLIAINQDGGAFYTLPVQSAELVGLNNTQIKTWLNDHALDLYPQAQANGRFMDLFNDLTLQRYSQATDAIMRTRFNAIRSNVIAATSLANLQTRFQNLPNLTAQISLQEYLDWLDTNPAT